MAEYKLGEIETIFADIIWDNEPVTSLISEQLPIAEPLQNGVSGGSLPVQSFLRQFRQTAGGNRLIVPDNICENGLDLTKLIFRHKYCLLYSTVSRQL